MTNRRVRKPESIAPQNPLAENGRDRALLPIAEIFRRYGYEAATMSILSQETGLGRSSLYHHFPGGKEEMALAVLDLSELFLRDDLLVRLEGDGTPKQRVSNFIERLKDYYQGGAVGCVFASLTLHDCPPVVAARVSALMHFWIKELAARLAKLGVRSSMTVAGTAIRHIQGGLVVSLATQDRAQFDSALRDLRPLLLPNDA